MEEKLKAVAVISCSVSLKKAVAQRKQIVLL